MKQSIVTLVVALGAVTCWGNANAAVPACSALALGTANSTPFSVNGNTCTDANNGAVATACQNQTLNGAGAAVYGVTFGGSHNNVNISVQPTGTALPCSGSSCGFFPGIYLMDITNGNSCGSQACTNTAQTTSVTTSSLSVPNSFGAAGTFYFFVADTGSDSPGCGPYTLSVSGTLPVKLQKFSVN